MFLLVLPASLRGRSPDRRSLPFHWLADVAVCPRLRAQGVELVASGGGMDVQAESERRSHVQRTTFQADACPELVQGSALGLRSASDAMYMYLYLLRGFV